MDLDSLLHHYLGDEPDHAAAHARVAIDFGVERDAGRRFALWSLMAALGDAPDPQGAFEDAASRQAAHDVLRLMRRDEANGGGADDAVG